MTVKKLTLPGVHRTFLRTNYYYQIFKYARTIFSVTGEWNKSLSREVKAEIEDYWRPKLQPDKGKRTDSFVQTGKDSYYVLSMFPYPSGKLHMGHVRVYTISDVIARFHRLQGKQVFHPIGWDAFGLPAENAAMERGVEPGEWTKKNISSMRQQLEDLCCSFDWDVELSTCDPRYYKWTQYIFLKMFEAGLVYQKKAEVNWDPVDKTVLANEQVDEEGRSWRSGAYVQKRNLKQWYIRTTAYSKALLEGLEEVDTNQWKDIVAIQKHWIGECTGCRFEFKIKADSGLLDDPLSVFTETPELIFGVSHIAVSTNHILVKELLNNNSEKAKGESDQVGRVLPVRAVHPFTGDLLPVIMTTQHFPPDCDAYLGIPNTSAVHQAQADSLGCKVTTVLSEDSAHLINSQQFTGMERQQAADAITQVAQEGQFGGHMCSAKLKDWLISRQRYWGTPIPFVHCPKCQVVPVPYKDLPVILPPQTSSDGMVSLDQMKEWHSTTCPQCGGAATRETDTMDTFVDSSWYFLRYLDSHNNTQPFRKERADTFMPVNLYIGGKEHALLHLFYARFFTHFLSNAGYVTNREPFLTLLTQGMVQGRSYRVQESGRYISPEQVDFSDMWESEFLSHYGLTTIEQTRLVCVLVPDIFTRMSARNTFSDGKKPVEKHSQKPLEMRWEKMSKSKYNGVDPQEVIEKYGVDASRLCILSNVSPKSDRKWSYEVFTGVHSWQNKVWKLVGSYMEGKKTPQSCDQELLNRHNQIIEKARNDCVHAVTMEMKRTFMLNSAISRFHSYTSMLKQKIPPELLSCSSQAERALADLIIMISPFAPSFASELWSGMASCHHLCTHYDWSVSVLEQQWPVVDDRYILHLKFQVNNMVPFSIKMTKSQLDDLTEEEALCILNADPRYQKRYKHDKTLTYSHFVLEPALDAYLYFKQKTTE